jgi:8-oxo-dGTP diphosphatase
MMRPRVGVGVFVVRDGKVLLMRRTGAHGAGTWSPPGGHLDFGESPEVCAAREVMEEVGLAVTGLQFKGITNDVFAADGLHYITIWMEGRCTGGEARVASPGEATEVGWFAWDALPVPLFLPLENWLAGRCYIAPATEGD